VDSFFHQSAIGLPESQTMGWIDTFLETIAAAAANVGKAVQS
jgi:hypothetical protein